MEIQVKDPESGKLITLRDTELVQEVNRLNVSVQNLTANLNNMAIELESLKTQFKSAVGQSVDILDSVNGEEV